MSRTATRSRADSRDPFRRPHLPFRPIVAGFLLAGAALTAAAAWLIATRLQTGPLPAYAAAVNVTTFFAYLYDKSVSGGALWRVPETVLHLLALAGGTPGALAGQILLRHKTRKTTFRAWFWGIVVLQVLLLAGWWYATQYRGRDLSAAVLPTLSVGRYAEQEIRSVAPAAAAPRRGVAQGACDRSAAAEFFGS
jgi:uncharacterized membrane protein YsdA (DUF1294 family)